MLFRLAQCQTDLTAAHQQAAAAQYRADVVAHQGELAAADSETARLRAEASEAVEEDARGREEAAHAAVREAGAGRQRMLEWVPSLDCWDHRHDVRALGTAACACQSA